MKLAFETIVLGSIASASPSADLRQSLDVQIPILPSLVSSDGRSLLAFEVHATNFTDKPLVVHALRIVDGDAGRPLATYAGKALSARIGSAGDTRTPAGTVLVAGGRAIVYVELDLARRDALRALRVEIDCLDPDGGPFTIRTEPTSIDRTPVPTLAPPMKTGVWVAVHDPSWERGHRRVIYTLGGRARIPGRYAIDWAGVDEKGSVTDGDPDRPSDAVGYGTAVLAGADAVVAAVRDDMQEALSISGNPAQALGNGSGNYVVLRLSPNRYAFYEHLRPGSVSVRSGDHVRSGQTIGAVGFTGDTTGPHLHLHMAECSSPLACEGVPFTVSGMTALGTYRTLSDLGVRRWSRDRAGSRIAPEWPASNLVVRFRRAR